MQNKITAVQRLNIILTHLYSENRAVLNNVILKRNVFCLRTDDAMFNSEHPFVII